MAPLVLTQNSLRKGRKGLYQYPDQIPGCCGDLRRDEDSEDGSAFYVETWSVNAPDKMAGHLDIKTCKAKHFVEGETR